MKKSIILFLVIVLFSLGGCNKMQVELSPTPTPQPGVSYNAKSFLTINDLLAKYKIRELG